MVVTEALARGLPVVATAVGGVPEALGTRGRRAPAGAAGAARATPAALARGAAAAGSSDAGAAAPACGEGGPRAPGRRCPAGRTTTPVAQVLTPSGMDGATRSGGPACRTALEPRAPAVARRRGCAARAGVWSAGGWAPGRSSTACAAVDAPRRSSAALAIAALTTLCCAWRWSLVARGLGVRGPAARRRSPPTTAPSSSTRRCPAACSATCTAGCGTVETSATLGRGLRAVAWERAGRSGRAGRAIAVVVLLAAAVAGARLVPSRGRRRRGRPRRRRPGRGGGRAARRPRWSLARRGVARPRATTRPRLLGAAVPGRRRARLRLVVVGHVATFLVAARDRRVDRVAALRAAAAGAARAAGDGGAAATSPAGGRARAWPRGCSGRRARRRRRASRPPSCTASWCSSPACPAPSWSPRRCDRLVRSPAGDRAVAPELRGAAWLSARTPCSAAACRSTATSTARPTSGCCCPTTPTSTGSTRCAPSATRSWSAPRTVRKDNPRLLVRGRGAPRASGWPAGCRRRRSR